MFIKSKRTRADGEKAFIIPVVILLGVVGLIFLIFLVNNMHQSKSQKLATTHSTKAYFMAQAGVQQMKLKYKLLPQETFNAGYVRFGFNPWYFDHIDDFSSGGKKFPIFLASMGEDITTRTTTTAGDPALVPDTEDKQIGGFEGMPLDMCGFDVKGLDSNEDISEGWGYDLKSIDTGSIRYYDKTIGGKKYKIKEQTIVFSVVGYAKQELGHLAKREQKWEDGEEFIKKWEAKETMIVKSLYTGKDYE